MKIGLFLSAQFDAGADAAEGFQQIRAQAVAAEQLGFSSIVLGHHYLTRGGFMQPLPLLAYLAGQTSRVELITGVLLLPLLWFHLGRAPALGAWLGAGLTVAGTAMILAR